eukprot:2195598-Amphidinium_carterae.1
MAMEGSQTEGSRVDNLVVPVSRPSDSQTLTCSHTRQVYVEPKKRIPNAAPLDTSCQELWRTRSIHWVTAYPLEAFLDTERWGFLPDVLNDCAWFA